MSDHKLKKLVVDVRKSNWKKPFVSKRIARVRWEALKVEAVEERFQAVVERKMGEMSEGRGDSTRWSEIADNLVEAAKESCGEQPKTVENEWMVNKEEEDRRLKQEITSALEEKNEAQEKQRRGEATEEEVEAKKERIKEARSGKEKGRDGRKNGGKAF